MAIVSDEYRWKYDHLERVRGVLNRHLLTLDPVRLVLLMEYGNSLANNLPEDELLFFARRIGVLENGNPLGGVQLQPGRTEPEARAKRKPHRKKRATRLLGEGEGVSPAR